MKYLLILPGVLVLLVLIAVVRTLVSPRKTSGYQPPQTDEAEALRLAGKLSKMIQVDTTSHAGGDDPARFRAFHKTLAELFPRVFSQLEKTEIDGNLLFYWKGRSQERPILLMSHQDVVPAEGAWSHAPFSGDIADGKVWGRGASDTKCSVMAFFEAAEQLLAEGYTPPTDVYLASSCTEEWAGDGAPKLVEELRRRGVLLMATTHYAELKVFALETKGVVNASCEFDLETLRPTYKLSVGVPGKSNAFLISEKLGIPERVIEAAQQHLSAEDKRLDAVLGQLDDLKLQLKESQNEVEELKNEASHQLEAAQKKRDELIQQGENELEAARAKARALAQQVESQAYALTDELRQLQKDERMSTQQKAQRAREIAKKESEKLFIGTEVVHNPVKEFVPLKEVKVGQEVCIAELNQLATVLALPDKNGDVLVRAGIIKTKIPLKGLKQPEKLVKETKPQTKAQQRYSRLTGDANRPNGRVERVQRSAKMECNLLGLTVDEALPEVDSFIDRAILNGQTVVYLIHGNGTGALRTAIHKHLRGNRMVKSFRLGRYGEGESGVTVVELK